MSVTILEDAHKWNLANLAKQISKVSQAVNADIIYAHIYFPAVSTALARAMAITSVKTCVTFHNLTYAGTLLHKLGDRQTSPIPAQTYPTTFVMGMPIAV